MSFQYGDTLFGSEAAAVKAAVQQFLGDNVEGSAEEGFLEMVEVGWYIPFLDEELDEEEDHPQEWIARVLTEHKEYIMGLLEEVMEEAREEDMDEGGW